MSDLPNIVSFSGGQTSGYMLRKLMERSDFAEKFCVVFENTGREHNATLDFVHEVETRWGVPIVWLEYCRIPAVEIDPLLVPAGRKRTNLIKAQEAKEKAHWFREVSYETAARRTDPRTPFDELLEWSAALPNVRGRSCSAFLKRRTLQKWLEAKATGEYNCYIGIRKDEEHRAWEIKASLDDKNEHPQFPLCDEPTTKASVDAFWAAHSFCLNIPNHMGNCDLCFLKARWKRLAVAKADPVAAQWWAGWEAKMEAKGVTGDGARFIAGRSYEGLIHDAGQPELPLDKTEQDIPCSCAVGGYRGKEDED